MSSPYITLSEALTFGRLEAFIGQAEAAGIGSANHADFDAMVGAVVKAPQPSGRTSRSAASGGSPGK